MLVEKVQPWDSMHHHPFHIPLNTSFEILVLDRIILFFHAINNSDFHSFFLFHLFFSA